MAGERQFAIDAAGNPVELQSPQLEGGLNAGFKPVSKESAQASYGAQQAAERVDQRFGTVGKALAGVGGGLTLGLGPALAQHAGLIDQPDLEALQETGAYQAGDIAGMIAPAFLSGGESLAARGAISATERAGGSVLSHALGWTPAGLLTRVGSGAERLLGGVLPEVSGLGGLGRSTLQMAARGAAEGAVVNLSHTVADSVIQNKQLTAQALAASGVDGALFGGLAGGVLGGVGAVAGAGIDAIGGAALSRGVGRGERSAAIALKRMGADEGNLARLIEENAVEGFHKILAEEGGSYASSTSQIRQHAASAEKRFVAVADDVLTQLNDGARSLIPDLARVEARIQTDLEVKYGGTMAQAEAQRIQKGLQENLAELAGGTKEPFKLKKPELKEATQKKVGKTTVWDTRSDEFAANMAEYNSAKAAHEAANPSGTIGDWKSWAKSYTQLSELAEKSRGGVQGEVYQTALNAMRSEIRSAMEAAEESLGKAGLSEQYQAALVGKKMSQEMSGMIGKRAGAELAGAEPAVGARDVGTFVGMSAIGHPLSGAGFVAAKGIGKILQRRVEPQIAEAAYRMSVGAQAAGATVAVGQKIQGALRSFLGVGGRVAATEYAKTTKVKYTPEALQKTLDANDKLTGQIHQARVQEMANALSQMGHGDLAQEMLSQNQRAVEYLQWNAQKVNKKAQKLGSLGKPPKIMGLDDKAYKYLRIDRAIKHPLSILDGLEDGSVSRDQVKAVKYVYPELHAEIVSNAATEIMAMKNAGKFLPADKIANLGLVLDSVVDTTLEKSFIDGVQRALAANNAPQPAPQQSGGQGPGQSVASSSDYQTPLQSSLQA